MGLIKTNGQAQNAAPSQPLPPPLGIDKTPAPKTEKKSSGGNVRGQVFNLIFTALAQSPEYAGRYTTHQEWKDNVKKDSLEFLNWFESEGMF